MSGHPQESVRASGVLIGYDQLALLNKQVVPYRWDLDKAVNRHALLVGRTGSGKSSELKKIVRQIRKVNPDAVIYCYDCHGDLRFEGGKVYKINQSGEIGLNPLKISSHPEYGGVRAKVAQFLYTVEHCQKALGSKQEACLRYLIIDLFRTCGVDPENPSTWEIGTLGPDDRNRVYVSVPFEEKDEFKASLVKESVSGGWSKEHNSWYCTQHKGSLLQWQRKNIRFQPDLGDLLSFAKEKLVAMHRGINDEIIRVLQELGKNVSAMKSAAIRKNRSISEEDDLRLKELIAKQREKAMELFSSYMNKLESGKLNDDDLKYDSTDVLKSVVSRLENLLGSGIFKEVDPHFEDEDKIRIFDISALSESAQRMFVSFFTESEYLKVKEQGITTDLKVAFIVDEADKYFSDDDENILNKLSKESRKFGVSLIAASQGISHFSKDFIAAVATKVILKIDQDNAKEISRRFNVPETNLSKLKAHHTVAMQVEYKGENDGKFVMVNVNHAVMAKLNSQTS